MRLRQRTHAAQWNAFWIQVGSVLSDLAQGQAAPAFAMRCGQAPN
jgi:hypothetical protein